MFDDSRTTIVEDLRLTDVLAALSDPVRLQIVAELDRSGSERSCKSFELPVTKSTCTHHFRVLREAGVILQREVGTTKLNSLRRDELDERFPGLLDSVLRGAESPDARATPTPAPDGARSRAAASR